MNPTEQGSLDITQASFAVVYKGQSVGEYFADILVDDVLVVELKCVERLAHEHTAQCLNFPKPKVEWKRIVQGYRDQPS